MTTDTTLDLGRAKADPYLDSGSIEFRFRARRFAIVERLIRAVLHEKGHADIVDLGGTETYWRAGGEFIEKNRKRLRITLVNPPDGYQTPSSRSRWLIR